MNPAFFPIASVLTTALWKGTTMHKAAGLLLLAALFFLSACDREAPAPSLLNSQIGQFCSVQFRRGDALGAAAPLPVSPITGGINGADVTVDGKFINVSEE